MAARPRALFVTLLLTLLIGGPFGYAIHRERAARSFRVVEPGVLYRSGQLPISGLRRIVHDHNIRTIISLRESDRDDADAAEVRYCRRLGLRHVRIPPRAWWASEGPAPAEQGLRTFREVMDDPANYPVLIHCYAGVHRTGAYCAIFRMDYHGWSKPDALAEMKRLGYRTLDGDWDVMTFLENYQPETRRLVHVRP